METCGIKLAQILCFIFNLLLAIAAIVLISLAIVVQVDINQYSYFMEGSLKPLTAVSVIAGAFLFLLALLGFWTAIRKSYHMLVKYGMCLLVIFLIELAVGIGAAVYNRNFKNNLKDNMKESMDSFYTEDAHKRIWDDLQGGMRCCGVDGPSDWGEEKPMSCCINLSVEMPPKDIDECTDKDVLFSKGCYEDIRKEVNKNTKILMTTGFAMALLQIVGLILALLLALAIKKEESQATQE